MIDTNKLNQFAGVIAADLIETERSIDQSIAKAGMLLTTLVSGRLEADIPAQTGQIALAKLGEAINAAIAYRSNMVMVHRSLDVIADKLGVVHAAGPFEPKPDDGSKHTPLVLTREAA